MAVTSCHMQAHMAACTVRATRRVSYERQRPHPTALSCLSWLTALHLDLDRPAFKLLRVRVYRCTRISRLRIIYQGTRYTSCVLAKSACTRGSIPTAVVVLLLRASLPRGILSSFLFPWNKRTSLSRTLGSYTQVCTTRLSRSFGRHCL